MTNETPDLAIPYMMVDGIEYWLENGEWKSSQEELIFPPYESLITPSNLS